MSHPLGLPSVQAAQGNLHGIPGCPDGTLRTTINSECPRHPRRGPKAHSVSASTQRTSGFLQGFGSLEGHMATVGGKWSRSFQSQASAPCAETPPCLTTSTSEHMCPPGCLLGAHDHCSNCCEHSRRLSPPLSPSSPAGPHHQFLGGYNQSMNEP